MTDDFDSGSKRRGPKRMNGRYAPGASGNPKGRPKHSKNIKTHMNEQLAQKITMTENGKVRRVSKSEAIATQLVAMAAKGDPKGIAAVMAMTRENEAAQSTIFAGVITREEDLEVIALIKQRWRAAEALEASEPGLLNLDGANPGSFGAPPLGPGQASEADHGSTSAARPDAAPAANPASAPKPESG